MTGFLALLLWRSFSERENLLNQIRVLVADAPAPESAVPLFRELIQNVIGASSGYLVPLGKLSPLVKPVAFPGGPIPSIEELLSKINPDQILQPVQPAEFGGASWAVPMWGVRGLSGILLLGEKMDGGMYAREEIEVARAAGERMLDTLASAELVRRLLQLQRRSLAEGQVVDRRTRRILHDEILPQLHAALLTLPTGHEAVGSFSGLHQEISDLLREMPPVTKPEFTRKGVIVALRQVVETEMPGAFESVDWQISDEAAAQFPMLPELEAEVVFYAARESVRNAARHASNEDGLRLVIKASLGDMLELCIIDNGISTETGQAQSGGSGLSLHSTMMAVVGGELHFQSSQSGTSVCLQIPIPVGSEK